MTQDRKDDSKGSKEIEKSRKKADSSASTSKEKTASSGDGLPTKILVRRLPPAWTSETFVEQVSPVPDHDYLHFVPGDVSLGQHAFSRAYINLVNRQDVSIFVEKFDGYVFVDSRGFEYPAVVEFAPFLKVPKKRAKKADPRKGTIESDDDYVKFVEKLENVEPEVIPPPEVFLEEIEAREKLAKENVLVTTPLIEFMVRRREEKKQAIVQAREERKRKETERRRLIEEQKRRAREQKQQRDREREREKDRERDRDRDSATVNERGKKTTDNAAPVKLLKNPDREREQKERERGHDERSSAAAAVVKQSTMKDSTVKHTTSKNDAQQTTERGERGGARPRPDPQRSTNRESDDRRGKHPTNERQDKREWKAEPEHGRQRRRDETRLGGDGETRRSERRSARDHAQGQSQRDHPQSQTDRPQGQRDHAQGQSQRDHPQSQRDHPAREQTRETMKSYGGYGRESLRDEKRSNKDVRPSRADKHTDRQQRDDDTETSTASASAAALSGKEKSAAHDKSSHDKSSHVADTEKDKDAAGATGGGGGSGATGGGGAAGGGGQTVDKDHRNVRQRVRYKDRPERAIYNPARRAVERQKDTSSSSAANNDNDDKTDDSERAVIDS